MAFSFEWTRVAYFLRQCFATLALLVLMHSSSLAQSADSTRDIGRGAVGLSQTLPCPSVEKATIAVGDAKDLLFKKISMTGGLSQTRVASIAQDDRGFIWFGTQYGLDRFDGYQFKVFKHNPATKNGLSGVYIHALLKDRNGFLWVASDEFLDRLDPVTEEFTSYPIIDSSTNRLSGPIHHISQDSDGAIWLATGSGLYRLDSNTKQTIRFANVPGDPHSLSSNDVMFSGMDREGSFWVVTSLSVDKFNRTIGRVSFRIPFQAREREASFLEDSSGTFWIIHASSRGGISTYDRKANRLTQYSLPLVLKAGQQFTGGRTILEDREGNVWIGTGGVGLLRFDRSHHKFIRYSNSPEDEDSLTDDHVTTLFQGREGNIGVGLHQTMPVFFNLAPMFFEKFTHSPMSANRLGGSLVSSINEDREHVLWIASAGALNRIDRKAGTNLLLPGGSIENEVHTMTQLKNGEIWIGTFMEGLKKMNEKTGQQTPVHFAASNSNSSPDDPVVRLLPEGNDVIWAATWNGLKRFDLRNQTFSVYKPDPLSRIDYYDIARDRQGMIWLAGSQGLDRFDPITHSFTVFRRRPGDLRSLSDNQVNAVHIEPDGSMWVATQNGFDHFDPATGAFHPYFEQDGLAGNVVNCVLGDEHGFLWMSTNNGLSKFDRRTEAFKNYSVADGLPGADLTGWGACSKSPSGEMFFGGFSGATAFFPGKVIENPISPRVVLTDLKLSGTSVNVGGGSPLTKSIAYTDVIALSHVRNIFSLEFSALRFFSPETIRYRYRLEGLDKQWHVVGSEQRIASYTTLPSGRYTFVVQAATSRGTWGLPATRLSIRILPPWWNTWWFRLFYIGVAVLCIWALYRYRLHQIAQQFNMRLEERVGERTRIARELHDTLLQSFQGLVLLFQTATKTAPEGTEARRMLDEVLSESDRVLVEGRERVFGLRGSATETNDLPDAFSVAGASLKRDYSGLFAVLVNGESRHLHPIVRDEVYRIGREALTNAFQHAGAHQIEVEISYERSSLRVRFRDDGLGIDPAVLHKGARPGHWGLPGMRERAEKIGARLAIWSRPKAGTEIELEVPAAIAYRGTERKSGWLSWASHDQGDRS
jgi:signal transduction histidine kinase/ligand-binding sensor domain-containing protein